jgi:hypothetical protein
MPDSRWQSNAPFVTLRAAGVFHRLLWRRAKVFLGHPTREIRLLDLEG